MAGRRARSQRDARRRSHSQNFLASTTVAAELVTDADVRTTDLVVEVGAGSGILTSPLAASAGSLIAIELDPVWAARLRDRFASDPLVRIVQGDAASMQMRGEPFRVFASLPFAQMTRMLRWLLDDPATPMTRADLIVQWEAGLKRIQLPPRNAQTICWSPWWTFAVTRQLSRRCFRPVPKVDAAMLRIDRRAQPLLAPSQRGHFVILVRAGFERVQVPLTSSLGVASSEVRRALRSVGADPNATASDLSARQWILVFQAIRQRG